MAHSWPGNIRELRNVVERGFILGRGKNFSPARLQEMFAFDRLVLSSNEKSSSTTVKRARLAQVLAKHKGNKLAAAKELGVHRRTIYNWLGEKG
jgi:DNA-binding NtrC family response regulator